VSHHERRFELAKGYESLNHLALVLVLVLLLRYRLASPGEVLAVLVVRRLALRALVSQEILLEYFLRNNPRDLSRKQTRLRFWLH
jgi:hypothetical protein